MRRRKVAAIAASAGIVALAASSVNYASASNSVPQSGEAAASVPRGGDGQTNAPLGGDGQTGNRFRNDGGRIHINERIYAAEPGVCTAAISSPATSFNVRNDSGKSVEFFSGITCDNGPASATIGPRNASSAIPGTPVFDGAVVPFALVGSFRVIDEHHH
ncbi:hypothetical protein RCO28_36315 [Streptomyces sp. LHD-70]|uniref:hypothetical protein n=1 Tax=Streptomyces sp. LHD-70 TaxID=3072140 RepID=UPI0028101EEE|nr:hypothetical protein [Streptomyces sp. LHD-70]MDQ8707894.1 hypothetical protein [Streptomyces sp. LHD-70]